MNPPPQWQHDTQPRTDLQRALVARGLPNPLVIGWRWRYETVLVAGFGVGLAFAIVSFGAVPTILAVFIVALAVLCWPPARQLAADRSWCIITPHRVRVGCAEGLVYSSRGKIPIILWTSHQAFGERVLLWCRAGTSVEDFVSARAVLTAACWAHDIAIFFDPQRTHLVTLDVIRRPANYTSGSLQGDPSPDSTGSPVPWPHDQDKRP
jgi:hypothetical protein